MVEINKYDKDEPKKKPAWMAAKTPDGEINRPVIRCECGKWTSILNHHIHKDGRVTESYLHHYPGLRNNDTDQGCGWHVYLKLVDWTGEEFLPGKNEPKK